MGALILSSVGLGFATLIGKAQILPAPALWMKIRETQKGSTGGGRTPSGPPQASQEPPPF